MKLRKKGNNIMSKYKIIDIVHSGRKGIRGTKIVSSGYIWVLNAVFGV